MPQICIRRHHPYLVSPEVLLVSLVLVPGTYQVSFLEALAAKIAKAAAVVAVVVVVAVALVALATLAALAALAAPALAIPTAIDTLEVLDIQKV